VLAKLNPATVCTVVRVAPLARVPDQAQRLKHATLAPVPVFQQHGCRIIRIADYQEAL